MEIERIHIGLVRNTGIGAALVGAGAVLLTAWVAPQLAIGIALGGGIILGLYGLYRVILPVMLSAPTRRRSRVIFWVMWALKWPLIAAALYYSLKTGVASPVGLALGAGIVPAVAVLLVVRAMLVDAWRARRRARHAS